MSSEDHARGVMAMLVNRFETQQLERLLALKSSVDAGELLDEDNSAFLADLFEEAQQSKQLVDRHPEYHALYAQVARLYREIAEQALTNETRKSA